MLKRGIITLLPLAVLGTTLSAQDIPKRTIEVRIEGAAKDTVYLANYYGNKLYYSDTAVADSKGKVVFRSPRGYKAGVYAIVVPGPKYFEVVVNEPVLEFTTDKSDLLGKLQVVKSKENELFIGYIRFLNDRKLQGDALRAQLDAAKDPIGRAAVKARMEELDKEVKAYQHDLVDRNPTMLAAALVHMSMPVTLPEAKKADGSLDSAASYYQYRAHFWDNTDLQDDRIVRVPVFANRFDEYVSKVIPQIPDTINKLVDEMVARLKPGSELFKYVVHNITHRFETSEIMGMDGVFAHMALTYYCPKDGKPGQADWMEAEKLDQLCERAHKLAPLVLGKKAPALSLTDTTEQKWINFYDLPQEFIVIIFWDPHCGHCKEELPKIHDVYTESLKALGVEVYAVAKAVDSTLMADWKKFIREKNLDWVNVGLTEHVFEEAKKNPRAFIPRFTTIESLNYAETYDVYSTPKVFLVDGDRKFVGKSLSPEQIGDLVKKLKERKAKG